MSSLRGGNVTARKGVSPPTGLVSIDRQFSQGFPTPASQNRGLPGAPVRTWARLVRPAGAGACEASTKEMHP
jgi:hypothetical protein